MKLFKRKSANSSFKKRMTSAATRRKRQSTIIRRKILWRQRGFAISILNEAA
ncbi:hypothetical protein [Photobacterium jeanii]|uniref:hypothetical protein n=1 Tax=Photobacterium jeanii TaxID=858640 RepID=UPI000B1A8E7D|nr:hypothetical protein [Photobacterium jeanii]